MTLSIQRIWHKTRNTQTLPNGAVVKKNNSFHVSV